MSAYESSPDVTKIAVRPSNMVYTGDDNSSGRVLRINNVTYSNGVATTTDTAFTRGRVTTQDIGNSAVNTNQLANYAVTTTKLATGAVTTDKLANGAITAAQLSNISSLWTRVFEARTQPTTATTVAVNATAAIPLNPITVPTDVTLNGALTPIGYVLPSTLIGTATSEIIAYLYYPNDDYTTPYIKLINHSSASISIQTSMNVYINYVESGRITFLY